MLTSRIIPCLDVDAGRVVKGVSFLNLRDAGDPSTLASFYDSENADELVFLDITASSDGRNTMVDVVRDVSDEVFIPLTVGGGIRSVEDMRTMLRAGADKVAVNSAAINDPNLLKRCSQEFGAQCVVLAIDAQIVKHQSLKDKSWIVYTHGGRNLTNIDPIIWAQMGEELGAGEILLTSMDADGTKDGYDLELIKSVSDSVGIPIIASGGAGKLTHFYEALTFGKADAVLAASLFHFGEIRISEVKSYLSKRGLSIRR